VSAVLSLEDQIVERLGLAQMRPLKGGRTNRVWLSGDKVVKLFGDRAGTPLFGNSAALEWAALSALDGLEIAPRPVALHQTDFGDVLIYEHIPGAIGAEDLDAAAGLLGRLHGLKPPVGTVPRASRCVVQDGLDMLPSGHPLHLSKPLDIKVKLSSLVHRDPVFTNFICGPDGMRLIDWQCPALGDPVEDLAHFISPAMTHLYRGKSLKFNEIERFLGSYPEAAIVQNYRDYGHAYHWRMACYCAWQVARGNADYRPALKAEAAFLEALRGKD